MRVAAHPDLYDPTAAEPRLTGTRCDSCGRVCFPPLAVGCELCGAGPDSLQLMDLAARGTLYSYAVVHVHHGDLEAPFVIGEVQLHDGPVVRVMMADAPVSIGDPVQAQWTTIAVDENGNEVVEPWFLPTNTPQQPAIT
jgi:uncharacterized protein